MESLSLDYRFGHDVYRISVTAVIDVTLGRKMYRPEVVIEKNISEFDAEEARRIPVTQLFTSYDKAQRFALSYAKKLIEETNPLPITPEIVTQSISDTAPGK